MRKSGMADSPFFTQPKPDGKKVTPPSKGLPTKKEDLEAEKAVYQSNEGSISEPTERSIDSLTDRLTDQSMDQSTNRSTDQPADHSTSQLITGTEDVDALGPVVDRPRAFYITDKVDRWLDEAVRYLKEKGLHKADRSVLINALLHDPNHYSPASLDKLRARLLAHLTNKSLKRVQSTE